MAAYFTRPLPEGDHPCPNSAYEQFPATDDAAMLWFERNFHEHFSAYLSDERNIELGWGPKAASYFGGTAEDVREFDRENELESDIPLIGGKARFWENISSVVAWHESHMCCLLECRDGEEVYYVGSICTGFNGDAYSQLPEIYVFETIERALEWYHDWEPPDDDNYYVFDENEIQELIQAQVQGQQ